MFASCCGEVLALLTCAVGLAAAEEELRLVPVRAIKSEEKLLDATPDVTFVGDARGCRVSTDYFGTNPTEAYFDILTPARLQDLPRVRLQWPGANVRRVLVGRTPVECHTQGDSTEFGLVEDTRDPFAMHASWNDVPACTLTYMHKPEARRSGPHRDAPWSEKTVRAEGNLMFGALEAFRDLQIGQDAGAGFDGKVHIIGYETTFPRRMAGDKAYGHADFPPHLHVFLVVSPGWRIREATHFYLAPDGTLTGECRCQPSATEGPSVTYHQGEYSAQKDMEGRTAFEVGVTEEGYLGIRRATASYTVRPAGGHEGFAEGADVFRGDERIASVQVVDDCPAGKMTVRRTLYGNAAAPQAEEQVLLYDPELGAELSRTTGPVAIIAP